MSSVRVLSIDGGGIKGIITAKILVQLEDLLKKYSHNPYAKIADYFDLIAGTSTGAILAALYLCPGHLETARYSAREILDFYLRFGKEIFKRRPLYPLYGSKYTNQPLRKLLQSYLGNLMISDLSKPCLLTSYDMTQRKSIFFNSLSSKKDPARDYPVSEAVLASASAPTYFPPSCLYKNKCCSSGLIDGGVFANNPSMCALIEALKLTSFKNMEDLLLLSAGNAKETHSYTYESALHWGVFQWAIPIFNILADSGEQTISYQMDKLFESLHLSEQYLRVQYQTAKKVPAMDDVSESSIKSLLSMGDQLILQEQNRLEEFAKKLVQNAIE